MNQAACAVVLALLAGTGGPALAGADRLELAPCEGEGMGALRCGTLLVPENHAVPGGRMIPLNIIVLPALDPGSQRAPLFSLSGGPGMAATDDAGFFVTDGQAHRQDRDLVLVDQRGTGRSAPLRCPALEAGNPLQRMYPPDEVRACRDELSAGHDLTQYTTMAAARDLEAVRQALDYETIDLVGLSYGTRLAQTYARMYPDRVRALALLGTVPMDRRMPLDHATNAQAVLDAVFADCAADAACHAAFPRLRQEWATVLARMEQAPIRVDFVRDGQVEPVEIQRGPFGEAFRSLLLTTSGQRRVPGLIHRMAAGDFQAFLEPMLASGPAGIAEGLYLSVACGEDTRRIEPGEIESSVEGTFLGRYRIDEQVGACSQWPASTIPPEQFTPVELPVPVLLMAGTMDYVTPISWATEVASRFPNSRVVAIEQLGHFPVGLDAMDCYDRIIADFFKAGDANTLDLACVGAMVPPPFEVEAKPAGIGEP